MEGEERRKGTREMLVTMFLFWIRYSQGQGLFHPISCSPFPSTLTAVLGGGLLLLPWLVRNAGAQEVELNPGLGTPGIALGQE